MNFHVVGVDTTRHCVDQVLRETGTMDIPLRRQIPWEAKSLIDIWSMASDIHGRASAISSVTGVVPYLVLSAVAGGRFMHDKNEIMETVSLYLLQQGYSILRKSNARREGVDIVAREAASNVKIHIVAKGDKSRLGKPYSDSDVFARVAKAIYSLVQVHESGILSPGDKTAFAVPDTPVFRKYLSFLDSLMSRFGTMVFFVTDEKSVKTVV